MDQHSDDEVANTAPDERRQALLEFVVAQSSVVFYIAELEGDTPIRFISSNVETITGHKPADFLADPNYGYRHIHPDDLSGYRARIEEEKLELEAIEGASRGK